MLVIGLLKSKGAGTELAGVRHFASVESFVLLQKVFGGKELGAYITLPVLRRAAIFRCSR